jgi:hypothetical protein
MMRFNPRSATALLMAALCFAEPAVAQQVVTLPRKQEILKEAPTPLWSVGKEEGESWELLSNVSAAAFDRQGNLHVLDAGNHRVLVFDPRGRFLRQIGKEGQGPGEISFAMSMTVLPDGRVVVFDIGRSAYSLFKPDGEFIEQRTAGEYVPAALGSGGLQASPIGGVVTRVMQAFTMRPGEAPGPRKGFILHDALSGDEAGRKPLHAYDMPAPKFGARGGNRPRLAISSPRVFEPQIAHGVLPDGGIALNDSVTYAIRTTDAQGRIVRTIRRDVTVRKATDKDREAAREQRRRALSGEGGSGAPTVLMAVNAHGGGAGTSFSFGGGGPQMTAEQIEEQVEAMEFAEVIPLVQGLSTDLVGRIWVERWPNEPGEIPDIELVTAEGRYIGTLRGMRRPAAVNADGSLGAWIERDEMDVERVIVRRLPASWT